MDPKQKPTSSVPSCHEVQGYMPGRLEFETEYFNEAEEAVQHMQFEPGDGVNPRTGELEPEMELKMTVMHIYNHRLTARLERKKIIFEHNLLEYRKNAALDKKRTKDERELANKMKPFARMMNHEDYERFSTGIEYEHNLRVAIQQLQEWRKMQITDLKGGEKYEHDKAQRQARAAANGALDRGFAITSRPRPNAQPEPPSAASGLLAQDLHIKPPQSTSGLSTPPESTNGRTLTNGNGTDHHQNESDEKEKEKEARFHFQPLDKNRGPEIHSGAPDFHLLTADEQEVVKGLKIQPKAYMVMKDAVIKEAFRSNGALKKKTVRDICRIDTTKASRLFDFFLWSGWIIKA